MCRRKQRHCYLILFRASVISIGKNLLGGSGFLFPMFVAYFQGLDCNKEAKRAGDFFFDSPLVVSV